MYIIEEKLHVLNNMPYIMRYNNAWKDSSPKNEDSVMIYRTSGCSKPVYFYVQIACLWHHRDVHAFFELTVF